MATSLCRIILSSLVCKYWWLLELHVTLQVFELTVFTSLWDSTDWLLSEIQTTLSMFCNLFLILRPYSQPSATNAPDFTASSAQLYSRQFTPNSRFHHHRFFGSCNWNKMWICSVLSVFNVILSAWGLTCLRKHNNGYIGHHKLLLLVHMESVLKYVVAYSLHGCMPSRLLPMILCIDDNDVRGLKFHL